MLVKVTRSNVGLGFHAQPYKDVKNVYEIPVRDAQILFSMSAAVPYVPDHTEKEAEKGLDDYTEIHGIGDVTERQIRDAFKQKSVGDRTGLYTFDDLSYAIENFPEVLEHATGKSLNTLKEWKLEADHLEQQKNA